MKTATNLNQGDPSFIAFLSLSSIQDSAKKTALATCL